MVPSLFGHLNSDKLFEVAPIFYFPLEITVGYTEWPHHAPEKLSDFLLPIGCVTLVGPKKKLQLLHL